MAPYRFSRAAAFLAERTQARRGGAVSARTERRDRARLQALARHPGVVATEDAPALPAQQGPTPVTVPDSEWSEWTGCPSTGGRSGAWPTRPATTPPPALCRFVSHGVDRVEFQTPTNTMASGRLSGTRTSQGASGAAKPIQSLVASTLAASVR